MRLEDEKDAESDTLECARGGGGQALVDRAADMSRETALQVRGVDPDHKHVHR